MDDNYWHHLCVGRIKAVAEILDAVLPNWASKVNVQTLDMSSGDYCILGQAFAPQKRWYLPRTWFDTRSGFGIGRKKLKELGYTFTNAEFASDSYLPYWKREIYRRVGTHVS